MTEKSGSGLTYHQYRRKQIAELADWHPGFDMTGVSISEADKAAGSPKEGDKIARNPVNHADVWLVAADYFAVNFEPCDMAEAQRRVGEVDVLTPFIRVAEGMAGTSPDDATEVTRKIYESGEYTGSDQIYAIDGLQVKHWLALLTAPSPSDTSGDEESYRTKYLQLSAQHARLCDQVYEDDGETLKRFADDAIAVPSGYRRVPVALLEQIYTVLECHAQYGMVEKYDDGGKTPNASLCEGIVVKIKRILAAAPQSQPDGEKSNQCPKCGDDNPHGKFTGYVCTDSQCPLQPDGEGEHA